MKDKHADNILVHHGEQEGPGCSFQTLSTWADKLKKARKAITLLYGRVHLDRASLSSRIQALDTLKRLVSATVACAQADSTTGLNVCKTPK